MRLLRPLATLALVIVVAGCSSNGGSVGWTFSPTPTPTAGPSGSGAAPSGGAPSGSAQAGGSAEPSGSGAAGAGLTLTAQNIAFNTKDLSAPANKAFTTQFTNNDQGVPHNVYIQNSSGTDLFKGDNVDGGSSTTYNVPALPAGTYKFYCNIHPTLMTGTLTVK